MSEDKRDSVAFAAALGALIGFTVLAKGAYDLWAATVVHVFTLLMLLAFVVRRRDSFSVRLLAALGLSLVLMTVSALSSIKPGDTLWALKDCFFAGLILVMAADVFESDRAIKWFLLIICVVVTVESGLMMVSRMVVGQPSETAGSLVNANIAAFFFLPWIPIFYEKLHSDPQKWPWLIALVGAIMGVCLASSYSALTLLILATPFFRSHRPNVKTLWPAAVAATLLIVGLLVYRNYQLGLLPDYRESSRLDWWKTGLAMFKHHPLVGLGLGNYQNAFLAYKTGLSQNTLFAHNFVVTLLSETGLVGFLGAGFLGTVIFNMRRTAGRWPFVLGLLLMLLYALYNIGPEYLVGKLLFAVFAGLIVVKGPGISLRASVVVVVVASGLAALPMLVTPFLASQNLVAGHELINSDIEKAREAYRAAVRLDPLLSEAHAGLARADFAQGRVNEAILHQQEAIRLDKLNQKLLRDLDRYQAGLQSNVS